MLSIKKCEKIFENSKIHLHICEIYRCRRYYSRETNIKSIKAHAENKHPGVQATLIDHLKISRNYNEEVSSI